MLHGKMHRCNFYLRLEKISSAVPTISTTGVKVQIVLNRMNLLHSEVNGGLPAAKLLLYRTFQELVFKEVEMGQAPGC